MDVQLIMVSGANSNLANGCEDGLEQADTYGLVGCPILSAWYGRGLPSLSIIKRDE